MSVTEANDSSLSICASLNNQIRDNEFDNKNNQNTIDSKHPNHRSQEHAFRKLSLNDKNLASFNLPIQARNYAGEEQKLNPEPLIRKSLK